jgi:hypothetical protein
MAHLLLGCCSGGLQTGLVAMDANDRRDIEIELVELLDKFLYPGPGCTSPFRGLT